MLGAPIVRGDVYSGNGKVVLDTKCYWPTENSRGTLKVSVILLS